MANELSTEVKKLADDAFEHILGQAEEPLRMIVDDWNVGYPFVENMFCRELGKMLISYSKK